MSVQLTYIGKKLVRANEALGETKNRFMHTVEILHTGGNTLDAVAHNLRMDAWCFENLGYNGLSLLPSDTGLWFKFRTKEDAIRFKMAF